jgi:hypothetical protein
MAAYVCFAGRNPALLELMFATKARSDAAGLQSTATNALSVVARLVDEGMAAGELAPRNRRARHARPRQSRQRRRAHLRRDHDLHPRQRTANLT